MSDIGKDGWPTADAVLRSERAELAAAQSDLARLAKSNKALREALQGVIDCRKAHGYTSVNRRADDMAGIARRALSGEGE